MRCRLSLVPLASMTADPTSADRPRRASHQNRREHAANCSWLTPGSLAPEIYPSRRSASRSAGRSRAATKPLPLAAWLGYRWCRACRPIGVGCSRLPGRAMAAKRRPSRPKRVFHAWIRSRNAAARQTRRPRGSPAAREPQPGRRSCPYHASGGASSGFARSVRAPRRATRRQRQSRCSPAPPRPERSLLARLGLKRPELALPKRRPPVSFDLPSPGRSSRAGHATADRKPLSSRGLAARSARRPTH